MKHALTTLRTQLETLVINERIHRNEGRDGEADNEAAWIAEIKEGIAVLEEAIKPTVAAGDLLNTWDEVYQNHTGTRAIVIGNSVCTSSIQVRNGVYRWSANPDVTYPSCHEVLQGEPFSRAMLADPEATAPDPVSTRSVP